MKKMKSIFIGIPIFILTAVLLFLPAHVVAAEVSSGSVGYCRWQFYEDRGELIIYPKGNGNTDDGIMPDFEHYKSNTWTDSQGVTHESDVPWIRLRGKIRKISIQSGVQNIGAGAFYSCRSVTVSLPYGGIDIGAHAFEYSTIEEIAPFYAKSVGAYAFQYATLPERLYIPSDNIGDYAFYKAKGLQTLEFDDMVSDIGKGAFQSCEDLRSISLGDGVSFIGDYAFAGYRYKERYNAGYYGRSAIYVSSKVESIGSKAFGYDQEGKSLNPGFVLLTDKDEDCAVKQYAQDNEIPLLVGEEFFTNYYDTDWMYDKTTHTLSLDADANYRYEKERPDGGEVYYPTPDASDEYWEEFVDDYGDKVQYVEIGARGNGARGGFNSIGTGLSMLPNLKGVTIVDRHGEITSIEPGVFKGLKNLTEVTLNDALSDIGDEVFVGCTCLETVAFGSGLKTIGKSAFEGCLSLHTIDLPGKLKEIKDGAFRNSGIDSLEIGMLEEGETYDPEEDYLRLGTEVFADCKNMISVTLGDKIARTGTYMFRGCQLLSSITLSDGVTQIGEGTFKDCLSLDSFVFGKGLTKIGKEAFLGTGVNEVLIPGQVEEIGERALCYVNENYSIHLMEDAKLYVIDEISEGVHSAGYEYAVANGIEYEINIGGTVGNCDWRFNRTTGAFYVSGEGEMEDYTLQNMAPWTPYSNDMTSVTIGDGITTVARNAFKAEKGNYSNLKTVVIGDSVTEIGAKAFYNCPLETVRIPDSVTTIASKAFGYREDDYLNEYVDTELTMIVEKDSEAENYAIRNGIYYEYARATGTTGECTYRYDGKKKILFITGTGRMGSYDYYDDQPWLEFADVIKYVVVESGVTNVGRKAFMKFGKLVMVILPETITEIEEGAMANDPNLKDLFVPDSVTSIADRSIAFTYNYPHSSDSTGVTNTNFTLILSDTASEAAWNYKNAHSLQNESGRQGVVGDCYWELGDSDNGILGISTFGMGLASFESKSYPWKAFRKEVKRVWALGGISSIPDGAFANLPNLARADFSWCGNITSIGKEAFKGDSALTEVHLPPAVTELADDTFNGCKSLKSIDLTNIRKIGDFAFRYCDLSQQSPDSFENLEEIGWASFAYTNLESFDIPGCLRSIGKFAFLSTKMTAIDIPKTVTTIGTKAVGYDAGNPNTKVPGFTITTPKDSAAYNYAISEGFDWIDPDEGNLGDIHWVFKETSGMLTISGEGAIPDVEYRQAPWSQYEGKVRQIIIEAGVTKIGENAFAAISTSDNKLKSIKIPGSVTEIGTQAFTEAVTKDAKLVIPIGTKKIGDYAFMGTRVSEITIPATVTEIGEGAFAGTKEYSVFIPRTVTSIGDHAFGFGTFSSDSGWEGRAGGYNLYVIRGAVGSEAEKYVERYTETYPNLKFEEYIPDPSDGKDHVLRLVEAKEATETEEGNIAYYICDHCGEWFADSEGENLITDHSIVIIPKIAKLNYTKKTLKAGKTVTLNITNGTVKSWKSSSTAVAKVSNKGVVTALKKGSSTITVTLEDDRKLTCKITVSSSPTITVGGKKYKSSTTYSVKKGKTLTVKITGRASSVANVYSTTKKTIAKVTTSSKKTSTVKIKGLKAGKATVTIKVNGVAFKIKVKVTK